MSSEQEPEFMAHVPGCRAVRWSEEFVDILPATGGKVNGLQETLIHLVLRGKQHAGMQVSAVHTGAGHDQIAHTGKPGKVSALQPMATPRRASSALPRVIRAALALSP